MITFSLLCQALNQQIKTNGCDNEKIKKKFMQRVYKVNYTHITNTSDFNLPTL